MLDYANKKMNKLTKMKSNGGRRKEDRSKGKVRDDKF